MIGFFAGVLLPHYDDTVRKGYSLDAKYISTQGKGGSLDRTSFDMLSMLNKGSRWGAFNLLIIALAPLSGWTMFLWGLSLLVSSFLWMSAIFMFNATLGSKKYLALNMYHALIKGPVVSMLDMLWYGFMRFGLIGGYLITLSLANHFYGFTLFPQITGMARLAMHIAVLSALSLSLRVVPMFYTRRFDMGDTILREMSLEWSMFRNRFALIRRSSDVAENKEAVDKVLSGRRGQFSLVAASGASILASFVGMAVYAFMQDVSTWYGMGQFVSIISALVFLTTLGFSYLNARVSFVNKSVRGLYYSAISLLGIVFIALKSIITPFTIVSLLFPNMHKEMLNARLRPKAGGYEYTKGNVSVDSNEIKNSLLSVGFWVWGLFKAVIAVSVILVPILSLSLLAVNPAEIHSLSQVMQSIPLIWDTLSNNSVYRYPLYIFSFIVGVIGVFSGIVLLERIVWSLQFIHRNGFNAFMENRKTRFEDMIKIRAFEHYDALRGYFSSGGNVRTVDLKTLILVSQVLFIAKRLAARKARNNAQSFATGLNAAMGLVGIAVAMGALLGLQGYDLDMLQALGISTLAMLPVPYLIWGMDAMAVKGRFAGSKIGFSGKEFVKARNFIDDYLVKKTGKTLAEIGVELRASNDVKLAKADVENNVLYINPSAFNALFSTSKKAVIRHELAHFTGAGEFKASLNQLLPSRFLLPKLDKPGVHMRIKARRKNAVGTQISVKKRNEQMVNESLAPIMALTDIYKRRGTELKVNSGKAGIVNGLKRLWIRQKLTFISRGLLSGYRIMFSNALKEAVSIDQAQRLVIVNERLFNNLSLTGIRLEIEKAVNVKTRMFVDASISNMEIDYIKDKVRLEGVNTQKNEIHIRRALRDALRYIIANNNLSGAETRLVFDGLSIVVSESDKAVAGMSQNKKIIINKGMLSDSVQARIFLRASIYYGVLSVAKYGKTDQDRLFAMFDYMDYMIRKVSYRKGVLYYLTRAIDELLGTGMYDLMEQMILGNAIISAKDKRFFGMALRELGRAYVRWSARSLFGRLFGFGMSVRSVMDSIAIYLKNRPIYPVLKQGSGDISLEMLEKYILTI